MYIHAARFTIYMVCAFCDGFTVMVYSDNRTVLQHCSMALRKYFPSRVWKGTGQGRNSHGA